MRKNKFSQSGVDVVDGVFTARTTGTPVACTASEIYPYIRKMKRFMQAAILVALLVPTASFLQFCKQRASTHSTANAGPAKGKLTGKVIKIADGDTFHMLLDDRSTVKVRLHGIDCPEKKQPFYQQATNYLSSLIFEKKITIDWKSKDRYGRLLAIAYVDGQSVNEQMISEGYAWHFTRYDQRPQWRALEQTARENKVGIWSQPNPVAPWNFRNDKK